MVRQQVRAGLVAKVPQSITWLKLPANVNIVVQQQVRVGLVAKVLISIMRWMQVRKNASIAVRQQVRAGPAARVLPRDTSLEDNVYMTCLYI